MCLWATKPVVNFVLQQEETQTVLTHFLSIALWPVTLTDAVEFSGRPRCLQAPGTEVASFLITVIGLYS